MAIYSADGSALVKGCQIFTPDHFITGSSEGSIYHFFFMFISFTFNFKYQTIWL